MTDTLERREAIAVGKGPCPCGHPRCRKFFLTGIGSFVQGSGFTEDEADRIIAALTPSPRVDEGRAREVLTEALEENDQFASAEGARNGAIGSWFVPSFVVIRAMIRFATEASAYPRKLEEDLAEAQKVMRAAHDNLIELNPNNYTHDDVCAANDSAVEAILLLADALGETHGKTPEWWAERRSRLTGGE